LLLELERRRSFKSCCRFVWPKVGCISLVRKALIEISSLFFLFLLIKFDADPFLAGPNGTPRDVAFLSNQQEVVEVLDGTSGAPAIAKYLCMRVGVWVCMCVRDY